MLGQDGMVAAFLDYVAAVYDGTGLVNGIVIYMHGVCMSFQFNTTCK